MQMVLVLTVATLAEAKVLAGGAVEAELATIDRLLATVTGIPSFIASLGSLLLLLFGNLLFD